MRYLTKKIITSLFLFYRKINAGNHRLFLCIEGWNWGDKRGREAKKVCCQFLCHFIQSIWIWMFCLGLYRTIKININTILLSFLLFFRFLFHFLLLLVLWVDSSCFVGFFVFADVYLRKLIQLFWFFSWHLTLTAKYCHKWLKDPLQMLLGAIWCSFFTLFSKFKGYK